LNAAYPDRPVDGGKALREMVHRYAAATLGFLIVLLAALAITNRQDPHQALRTPLALLILVVVQGMFGALTVTWRLAPPVVTLHLLGGLTTLALLWWLCLAPERRELHPTERPLRALALLGLFVLGVQIALGGWTSSNYAAIACPDVPTCQGRWWPQMDFRDAFVLWRGLGHNYEGGVLELAARVAIHLTHRIGALVTALVLGLLVLLTVIRARSAKLRVAGLAVALALALQLAIGVAAVVGGFPLPLATAHNAGAALLLLTTVTLLRRLRPLSPTWLSGERRT
jgi:cytochrome c oxidase assembly protein subunit 15